MVLGAFLKNCFERLGALDKNGDYGEFGARYRARGPSGRGGSASDGPRQQMGPSAKTHSDDVAGRLLRAARLCVPLRSRWRRDRGRPTAQPCSAQRDLSAPSRAGTHPASIDGGARGQRPRFLMQPFFTCSSNLANTPLL